MFKLHSIKPALARVRAFFMRKHFVAVVYFNNPVTRWQYCNSDTVPIIESDVILRRQFRWHWLAVVYADTFCEPLQNVFWRVERIKQ